jgi:hypothetical protein
MSAIDEACHDGLVQRRIVQPPLRELELAFQPTIAVAQLNSPFAGLRSTWDG